MSASLPPVSPPFPFRVLRVKNSVFRVFRGPKLETQFTIDN